MNGHTSALLQLTLRELREHLAELEARVKASREEVIKARDNLSACQYQIAGLEELLGTGAVGQEIVSARKAFDRRQRAMQAGLDAFEQAGGTA